MKKTLLSIFAIGAFTFGANAQFYTPSAGSPLANGDVGMAYAGQTVNADIPGTVDITGQDILDVLPAQAAGLLGGAISPSQTFNVTVTSTTLTVEGLPAGLSDDCNGCIVNGGTDRDIVISGTPTQGGTFTVDITSATTGSTTINNIPLVGSLSITFGDVLTIPGVPVPVPIPALPGVLDGSGYTMDVAGGGNSISEANDIFSLNFYPNPTVGDATLEVNSIEGGVANIEVFSITGSRVFTAGESINVGLNRITVDLNGVPAGIYMIRAEINGEQALIRTQKI